LLKRTPKIGAIVKTPMGRGLVTETNLITQTLKVKMDNTPDDAVPQTFKVKEVRLVKDGYIKLNKKEIDELKQLEDN
jgi:hypothetical protein